MSISRQNLSIVIVTIKSENVIHQCLRSIDNNIPIIVIENSKNSKIKKELESKYKNVRCIRRIGRRGLSSAVIEGSLSSSADLLLIMDADLQRREEYKRKGFYKWQDIEDQD